MIGRNGTHPRGADAATTARDGDSWEAALDWFMRLRERPDDPALQDRLAEWLAADPAHAEAFAKAERVWRVAGHVAPYPAPAHGIPVDPLPQRRRRSWRPRLAAAMAVAACLALVLIWPTLDLYLHADTITGTGETARLDMPDGSVVTLGPESAVAARYGTDTRAVTLLSGTAFFSVAPDAGRPFSVYVGAMTVTAVGTAFEVRKDDDGLTVDVAEGRVRVDAPPSFRTSTVDLSGGQRLTARLSAGTFATRPVKPSHVAAWQTGQLIVEEMPLRDVLARVEPFLHGRVLVLAPDVLDQAVSGVFDMTRPAEALEAAFLTHGATVSKIAPYLFVVKRG